MTEAVRLHVVTGPTASGKSELALALAAERGMEIDAADSMSIYRRMDIGTAKPSAADRSRVPHHCIDLVEPWEDFDSARFVAAADAAIRAAAGRGRPVLIVGGTPLYLMALLRGFFDGPSAAPEIRARLAAEEDASPGTLHERLTAVDAEAAARIHRNDRKRLVRALEVFEITGSPISALQQQFEEGPPRYAYRAVGLGFTRDTLRERVRERTRRMFAAGLVEEVREIESAGGFSRTAGSAIGYAEVRSFLAGELDADELPARVRSSTHRLVRRQETWFRRFPGLTPLAVEGLPPGAMLDALRAALFPEVATA